jgi:hypothetical protein
MDDALAICNKLIIECLGHGLDAISRISPQNRV